MDSHAKKSLEICHNVSIANTEFGLVPPMLEFKSHQKQNGEMYLGSVLENLDALHVLHYI